MSTYIAPPKSSACNWRKGPPPGIGWWPAGVSLNPEVLRYWDGACWSFGALATASAREAAGWAKFKCKLASDQMVWTDRWWGPKP